MVLQRFNICTPVHSIISIIWCIFCSTFHSKAFFLHELVYFVSVIKKCKFISKNLNVGQSHQKNLRWYFVEVALHRGIAVKGNQSGVWLSNFGTKTSTKTYRMVLLITSAGHLTHHWVNAFKDEVNKYRLVNSDYAIHTYIYLHTLFEPTHITSITSLVIHISYYKLLANVYFQHLVCRKHKMCNIDITRHKLFWNHFPL